MTRQIPTVSNGDAPASRRPWVGDVRTIRRGDAHERECERATALHESYLTLSWFFRSVLELETHESEAMELGGVIDPSVADRLSTVLPVEELRQEDFI